MAKSNRSSSSGGVIVTEEFRRCLKEVKQGANLFITGKAGTGKSTLLRLIQKRMGRKQVAVVAPTGVAALNVDGSTIHKYFGFRPDLTPDLRKYGAPDHLADIDILVIDEVSMVRADLMDMVSKALQFARGSWDPFGGTQIVMIGDLFQLPPVSGDELRDTYYATDFFFSSKAFLESRISTIELTQVFRQKDSAFVDVLNAIRDGSVTTEHLSRLNSRHDPSFEHGADPAASGDHTRSMTIATTRAYVDEINNRHLSVIPEPETVYTARRSGEIEDSKFDGLEELRLKPGAQVMMLINQDGYANGTVAEVRALGRNEITVYLPDIDEERNVVRHTWEILKPVRKGGKIEKEVIGTFEQFPMQLAWAVTVHKSQGKTFDRVVFDCKRIFEDGQTYVALSRCTSLDGLTLTQPIEPRHIKISSAVRRFYRSATRVRTPVMSGPIAFVGLHTTGIDKYRKLVEIGIIRVVAGKEVCRFSTLIAPGRDASDAASVGINASDLTMCPSIEEARDLVGLALDGASVIGCRAHDIFALSEWPESVLDEGVPFELGEIPFGKGEKPTALDLAEQAMADFARLHVAHRKRVEAVPVRFLSHTIRSGSYLFSREPIEGMEPILNSEAFARLEPESQAEARLGIAVALIGYGSAVAVAKASALLASEPASSPRIEAMRAALLLKAEKDRLISATEADFVNRFSEVLAVSTSTCVVEQDCRAKATFRKGMKIYLSGGPGKAGSPCEGMSKEDMRDRCAHAGLVFLGELRKKDNPDAVVVADLSTEGGSRRKADRWEVPVMSWEELLLWVGGCD